MLEAELSVWPLGAVFTSCWDTVLSEPVGVVLSSLPSLWENENSWRSVFIRIILCQAMSCLISKAYSETDVQSQVSGGPVFWNGYTPWSLTEGREDILSRTCLHEQGGKAQLPEVLLKYHTLLYARSVVPFPNFSELMFWPIKKNIKYHHSQWLQLHSLRSSQKALLVWLAAVEMQSHLVGLLGLTFVLTDPFFPSIGVCPGFYFQHWAGRPGGCDGHSALWALIFSLPWPGGWRNHSTESDCCCDGLQLLSSLVWAPGQAIQKTADCCRTKSSSVLMPCKTGFTWLKSSKMDFFLTCLWFLESVFCFFSWLLGNCRSILYCVVGVF